MWILPSQEVEQRWLAVGDHEREEIVSVADDGSRYEPELAPAVGEDVCCCVDGLEKLKSV